MHRVVPVVELHLKALEAFKLARHARADELIKRAIAKAEELFPPDSLVVSSLIVSAETMLMDLAGNVAASFGAGFEADDPRLEISLRRCRAGTLLEPTLDECTFFSLADAKTPLCLACAYQLLNPHSMPRFFRSNRSVLAPEVLRHGANIALEIEALGLLPPQHPSEGASATTTSTWAFTNLILNSILQEATPGTLPCGLNAEQVAVLRGIAQRISEPVKATSGRTREAILAAQKIRIDLAAEVRAADVARHGLRSCSRPGCGATEPHPKAFKVCSRCRGAAYCAPSCQTQDWTRHKREDGCKKKADA